MASTLRGICMIDYEQIAENVQDAIIDGGLFHAECAESREHACIILWSRHTIEQLSAVIKEGLDATKTHS